MLGSKTIFFYHYCHQHRTRVSMRETPSLWYAYTITSEAWRPESAHTGLPALRALAANAGGPGGTAATTSTATITDDQPATGADTLPVTEHRDAQHDRRGAALVGVHDAQGPELAVPPRAQGCLLVPGERGPAAAAAVGEVLRRARGALLHLRAHRPLLHRLAAGGLRLLRPHDP